MLVRYRSRSAVNTPHDHNKKVVNEKSLDWFQQTLSLDLDLVFILSLLIQFVKHAELKRQRSG